MKKLLRPWPNLIVVFLAANLAGLVSLLWAAHAGGPPAVEPGYYGLAMDHDAAARQAETNEALGWSLDVSSGPVIGEGVRGVTVRIADDDGGVVEGARVSCVAFAHVAAASRYTVECVQRVPGVYGLVLPSEPAGRWELRFVVTLGEDRFTAVRVLEFAQPGAVETGGAGR